MNRRFIAQRATTKQWLHFDLPIEGSPVRELSGPGSFSTEIEPEVAGLIAEDGRPVLEPWSTLLYLEEDGLIRWGGVLIDVRFEGPKMSIEAAGFTTYPHGTPYLGTYQGIQVDPADIVRHIWAHIQGKPDGNLNMQVVGTTSSRIGQVEEDVSFTTETGEVVEFKAGPYNLDWSDYVDCGREISDLADEAPFDWVEEHRWNADKTEILHEMRIADRIGGTRFDLRFVQGENVSEVIAWEVEGDDFANEVIGVGVGEGKGAVRSEAARRDGRLRRVRVIERKDVRTRSRLDVMTRAELNASSGTPVASSITIRQHPHAPLGAVGLGDVIRVQADADWLGPTEFVARVVAIQLTSDSSAELTLEPA